MLAESPSLATAFPRLLQVICEELGWDVGTVWLRDYKAHVLRRAETWDKRSTDGVSLEATSRQMTVATGVGLPGQVWSSGNATWIIDIEQDTRVPRADMALREGLHGAFGFPIRLGPEFLGVIEFFSERVQISDEDLLNTMSAIGSAIGQFIERKQAEEALERRERELNDFLENATVGLHWVDGNGRILWANQAELDLFGFRRDEYVGHNIAEFHADPEVIKDILARLARGETLDNYEARLRCKDGSIRYVLISSNGYFEEGKLVHSRCFSRDVTDRRRAEQATRLLADAGSVLAALSDADSACRKSARLAVPAFADWCLVKMVGADGALRRVAVAHVDPMKTEPRQPA